MKLKRMYNVWRRNGTAYFFLASRNEILKYFYTWLARIKYRGTDSVSYGQYGEDLIIDRLLGYKENGFYIDVGANHPINFSNTKKFYDRGWTGVNIDPNPECIKLFIEQRPRDTNLNIGVGLKNAELDFYAFNETEISTFSKEVSERLKQEGFHLRDIIKVKIVPLLDIFKQVDRPVDFISIDAEDHSFEVLKSNDWSKYRPALICIENDADHDYGSYLKPFGYKKVATTLLNNFYILDDTKK